MFFRWFVHRRGPAQLRTRFPSRFTRTHARPWDTKTKDIHSSETTLETSGEDLKLHSKRAEKMWNYTRNEWRRCENTLETSGEDHFRSSWFCAMCCPCSLITSPPPCWCFSLLRPYSTSWTTESEHKITLETSGEDVELHSKRVEKMWNYTRK